MKIHCSCTFFGCSLRYHICVYLGMPSENICILNNDIIGYVAHNLKEKCEAYFKKDYSSIDFIEIYYFDSEGNEIPILKKQKGSIDG